MVVEVERTVTVDASAEEVWDVLADPERRARAVGVVEDFRVEGEEYVWAVSLPVPLVRKTVSVRTRDVERDPPRFVRFTGDSSVFAVEGEHELTPTEAGCRVRNRFVVDGTLPGVETFFERNVDEEIENLLAEFRTV